MKVLVQLPGYNYIIKGFTIYFAVMRSAQNRSKARDRNWSSGGHNLDKFNIIPQLFPKKSCDFYTIRNTGKGDDCMLSFML